MLAVLALAGCAPSPSPADPPPLLTGELRQDRSQVEERAATAVLTAPEGAAPVEVTGLRLLLPGYSGASRSEQSTLFEPGRTVALRSGYGDPDCAQGADGPVEALLDVEGAPAPVRVVLADPAGRAPALHERECAARRATALAPLAWAPAWRTEGAGADLVSVGPLQVGPVTAGQPVTVETISSTTLFAYAAPLPLVLAPGESATLEVRLTPARCDLHAVAEDKQGFAPRVTLRVGGEVLTAPAWVPREQRQVPTGALLQRCGTG